MRLVTAIVQPEKLEDVQRALIRHGVSGMTISEVSGYGRQHGHIEVYRGAEFTIDFILKVRIEVLVDEANEDEIIDLIVNSARTGEVGDGKVWSMPISRIVRVRTGEGGRAAI